MIVQGRYRLGNEILKTMSAVWLAAALEADRLEAVWLPDFGLETPILGPVERPVQLGFGSNMLMFPMAALLPAIREHRPDAIVNHALGQRFEYFGPQLRFWRDRLAKPEIAVPDLSENEVLIHVRAEDNLAGDHRGYYPLPIDFYDSVCDELGMEPVFVGQFDSEHPYLDELREHFPGARFLNGSVAEDFEFLRRSRTKIMSLSSFAWTAAWLGHDDSRIIMPIGGLFNPILWPEINLIPEQDERFEFRWLGAEERLPGEPLHQFFSQLEGLTLGFPKMRPQPFPIPETTFGGDPSQYSELATREDWCAFAKKMLSDPTDRP